MTGKKVLHSILSVAGGTGIGIVVCAVMCAHGDMMSHKSNVSRRPFPMYEIVDEFKGCDVVRYTDHQNVIHYFLDCDKPQQQGRSHHFPH